MNNLTDGRTTDGQRTDGGRATGDGRRATGDTRFINKVFSYKSHCRHSHAPSAP